MDACPDGERGRLYPVGPFLLPVMAEMYYYHDHGGRLSPSVVVRGSQCGDCPTSHHKRASGHLGL